MSNQVVDFQISPDPSNDGGTFMPGSRYKELYDTLHDHVFHTVQSVEHNLHPSPPHNCPAYHNPNGAGIKYQGLEASGDSDGSEKSESLLTVHQKYVLWNN